MPSCSNGHEFELFQRMSDQAVDTCPECGADAERLLSAGAGLLFKGDGFYITDYRSDEYQKKASADKPGGDGGSSSSSGSSSGGSSSSGSSSSDSSSSSSSSSSSDS